MKSLATNTRNDIYISTDGKLALALGIEAIKQNAQHAMQAQLGEMVLALDRGMPLREIIWHRTNLAQFEAAARQTLRTVDGIVDIPDFEVAIIDGTLRYRATLKTIFGPSDLSVASLDTIHSLPG